METNKDTIEFKTRVILNQLSEVEHLSGFLTDDFSKKEYDNVLGTLDDLIELAHKAMRNLEILAYEMEPEAV